MRFLGRAAAAAVLAASVGWGAACAQTLKVGSKNFTEQFIVAELYAAALEGAGFKVDKYALPGLRGASIEQLYAEGKAWLNGSAQPGQPA